MILRPFHILFRLMIFAVVIGSTSACSSFGGDHTESDLDRYRKSPQYSVDQERFVNDRQEIIDQMKDKMFTWDGLTRRMFKGEHKVPEQKLPEETVSRDFFSSDSEKGKVIWLGHSSFLLRIDQKTILIDPVFANAGPFSFVGKRFQEPVLKLEDIPKVDLVLISHDHYDHLEMKTVRHLKDKGTRFIVPIGIGRHLAYWGVPQDRIHEKDWWQTETIGNLTITTAPARHYSGRSGFLDNDTLWASYVITNGVTNLYFSGDSGYGEHFREIGQKLGPFDIAFLENGDVKRPVSRDLARGPYVP